MKKLLLAVPLLISSCATSRPAQTTYTWVNIDEFCNGSQEATEFQIWHHFADTQEDVFNELVSSFNASERISKCNVTLKAVNKERTSNAITQLKNNMSTSIKDMPILWYGIDDYVTEFYTDSEMNTFLVALDEAYDNDKSFFDKLEQIYLLKGNSFGNGKRYSFPYALNTDYLYVDMDLFNSSFSTINETTMNEIKTKINNQEALKWSDLIYLRSKFGNDDLTLSKQKVFFTPEYNSYLALNDMLQNDINYFDNTTLKSNIKNDRLKEFSKMIVDEIKPIQVNNKQVSQRYTNSFFDEENVLFMQADSNSLPYITNTNYKLLPAIQSNDNFKSVLKGWSSIMFNEGYEPYQLQVGYEFIKYSLDYENHKKMVNKNYLPLITDMINAKDFNQSIDTYTPIKDINIVSEKLAPLNEGTNKYTTDIRSRMGEVVRRFYRPTSSACSGVTGFENLWDCITNYEIGRLQE